MSNDWGIDASLCGAAVTFGVGVVVTYRVMTSRSGGDPPKHLQKGASRVDGRTRAFIVGSLLLPILVGVGGWWYFTYPAFKIFPMTIQYVDPTQVRFNWDVGDSSGASGRITSCTIVVENRFGTVLGMRTIAVNRAVPAGSGMRMSTVVAVKEEPRSRSANSTNSTVSCE